MIVGIERDERRRRIVRAVERARDRVPRLRLHAEVERRVHLETAAEDLRVREAALVQLLLHVLDEVLRTDVGALQVVDALRLLRRQDRAVRVVER